MGYSLNRFVGSIDQNLICSICSCVLQDAVLTPCGHSFCRVCLDTWLERTTASTCPECRGPVLSSDVRPILSIRNLINNLHILCEYSSRGCRTVVKLEELRPHLQLCQFVPVECAGCGINVNRHDLADHHIQCDAIAAALNDEDDCSDTSKKGRTNSLTSTSPEVAELSCRVATLEIQLKRMKHDLEIADAKNKKLERELKKTKEDLEDKRTQLVDQQYVDFDPDYEYGYAPHTIGKLSCLISRFLLKPPSYIEKSRIFNAIKRCYDNYGRNGDQHQHDVHMLLATAYASNWFNEHQRTSFYYWLQRIARHRQTGSDLSISSCITTSNTASIKSK